MEQIWKKNMGWVYKIKITNTDQADLNVKKVNKYLPYL